MIPKTPSCITAYGALHQASGKAVCLSRDSKAMAWLHCWPVDSLLDLCGKGSV